MVLASPETRDSFRNAGDSQRGMTLGSGQPIRIKDQHDRRRGARDRAGAAVTARWAFLTVGLPGELRPDPDGVSTFRTARYDRGGCPLYPGDGGALPARCRARPSPAASQRPVPAPRTCIPPAGLRITGHQRGFTRFTRPACPSPVAPRMGRAALGPSPVLRTPPLPAAHDRAGPGVSTRPELRCRHNRPSNPRVHSQGATSCRNGICRCCLEEALERSLEASAGLSRRVSGYL